MTEVRAESDACSARQRRFCPAIASLDCRPSGTVGPGPKIHRYLARFRKSGRLFSKRSRPIGKYFPASRRQVPTPWDIFLLRWGVAFFTAARFLIGWPAAFWLRLGASRRFSRSRPFAGGCAIVGDCAGTGMSTMRKKRSEDYDRVMKGTRNEPSFCRQRAASCIAHRDCMQHVFSGPRVGRPRPSGPSTR